MSNELLTTTQAARLASVGASTIKRWADQGALPYVRTVGGHRRFERASVERVLRESAALSAPKDERSGGGSIPASPGAVRTRDCARSPTDLAPSWRATLQRAQRYELDGRLLEARARLGAWCDVADEVAAGLREIGLAWQRGELTIAEEHVASDGLARALARVGDTLPTRLDGPRFLLACAGSDEHTLGLSLAELCLRELGVSPVWLGRQTPVDELMRELRGPSVRGVVLSASAASGDWAELERTVQLVGAACEEASVSLVLGGAGAWPPNPLYGARASSFGDLRNLLTRPLGNGPS